MKKYNIGDMIIAPLDWRDPHWLACDARQLRKDRYPALYGKIGTNYGSAGDPWFQLPLVDEAGYPAPVPCQWYIYAGPADTPARADSAP